MAASRQPGRARSRFTLVLLVLTSITLITLDLRDFEPLQGARDSVLDAIAPVRDASSGALEPFGDAWNGAFRYDELELANEAQRDRIAELEGELALSSDAKETLERLYEELEIPYVGDIPTAVATVVFGPASNLDHTIEIDKGETDGVRVGMPVIGGAGLVGTVGQVSPHRAVVTLMTDPGFRVGVRLSDADDVGVARGQGRGRPLVVFTGIDPDLEIPEGELVTTSGLERTRFPANVPIGEVASSVSSAGELDQDLFVEPLVDLDSLAFVNVMLWVPED